MPDNSPKLEVRLTRNEIAQNALEAALKAVPWIGDPLAQFVFGSLSDLRMKRIENTLAEIGEAIRDNKVGVRVDTEEFANLLESVLPNLSRSVSEYRRRALRNLLINAARVEPQSPKWDEASLAAQLVEEIDPPGLAVIAALSKCRSARNFLSSTPTPRVFDGGTEFTAPTDISHLIDFSWYVVGEWTWRLREKRLLKFQSVDARGGFGGLELTPLGRVIVDWSLRS